MDIITSIKGVFYGSILIITFILIIRFILYIIKGVGN